MNDRVHADSGAVGEVGHLTRLDAVPLFEGGEAGEYLTARVGGRRQYFQGMQGTRCFIEGAKVCKGATDIDTHSNSHRIRRID